MIDSQRLRDLAETLEGCEWVHPLGSAKLCRDTADELDRLRKGLRLAIARAACTPHDRITDADVNAYCSAAEVLRVKAAQASKGTTDGHE